nr:hypothetical protein [Candidatus Sigynarchaeota archaeon]
MEKNKLWNMLAMILGLAAVGLPACMYINSEKGLNSLWIWTLYVNYEGQATMLLAKEAIFIPFFIGGVAFIAGLVLFIIASLPKTKLVFPSMWIPVGIMIGGMGMFVICGFAIDIEGPLLVMFPVPLGWATGIASCVFAVIPIVTKRAK